jgi:cell division protein ZapA
MGEVNLNINGRNYPIVCDNGQEQRILDLAGYIDTRLKEISASGAANNDNHLLVLTSLILADEIFELRNNLESADYLLGQSDGQGVSPSDEAAVVQAINSLANRINIISERIQNA